MILPIILIAAVSFIFPLIQKQKRNLPFRPPPGPKGFPLIGNLHQFDSSNPHLYFAKLAKIYGPILSLRLGNRSMVVIQSAKIAKEVLKTQEKNFSNRFLSVSVQRFTYNGLDVGFSPYGEYYREVKKIFVVHLLSNKRVQFFAPIRQEEVSRLINKISSLSSASEIVNLSELIVNYARSNICRMAFGKRYEDEKGSKSRFHGLVDELQALLAEFFFADLFPSVGQWLDKLTGRNSRLEKIFKEMEGFYEEIISDHLDPNKPKSDREDFIDILFHLKKERSFAFDLTLDHIKAILLDTIVGGIDTATAMIIWVMTELVRNPDTMKKVQYELRNTFEKKDYIIDNDLSNLEYFKAVVKETFRLHPATSVLVPRESLHKTTIEGYDILPKTIISINLWAIGRDPEIWNDSELFMPERFVGNPMNFKGHDFELIPFGSGKRMCPGMHLGVASMELVLANLLYYFDWEPPIGLTNEDIDTDMKNGMIMHKKNPLCLIANKFTL